MSGIHTHVKTQSKTHKEENIYTFRSSGNFCREKERGSLGKGGNVTSTLTNVQRPPKSKPALCENSVSLDI